MAMGASTVASDAEVRWSSRLAFVLAATGSAVGLGNIWKFPYVTGAYGGSAFVLVYLLCVAGIGLPLLISEVMLGRLGRGSPVHSIGAVARAAGRSGAWSAVGKLGVVAVLMILTFYSVVGGWTLAYIYFAADARFQAAAGASEGTAAAIGALFSGLLADPWALLLWHSLFMLLTVVIVARGVHGGLERATKVLMPGLFLLLLGLVVYAAVTTDRFAETVSYLFKPEWGNLSATAVLVAMGQAFFSLSLGMAIMLAYGSYLPERFNIGRMALTVAGLDTLVALLAGLAIFPLVFAHGLEPGAGPGLVFISLPIAFADMPAGVLVGGLFFLFVFIAAMTSSISMLEPAVEYLVAERGWRRHRAAWLVAGLVWLVGLGPLLSLNLWSEFKVAGKNLFDLLDFVTANLMLPLGGFLIAVFVGWRLSQPMLREALGMSEAAFRAWHLAIRFVTPVGVAAILAYGLT